MNGEQKDVHKNSQLGFYWVLFIKLTAINIFLYPHLKSKIVAQKQKKLDTLHAFFTPIPNRTHPVNDVNIKNRKGLVLA